MRDFSLEGSFNKINKFIFNLIMRGLVNIVNKMKSKSKVYFKNITFNTQKSLYMLAQVSATCRIALIALSFLKNTPLNYLKKNLNYCK